MTRFLSTSFFKTYVAWLLMPFLGIVFGALASTANLMIIGMSVASFIGIALLKKPEWNVELVIISGLICGLVLLFFDNLATKALWAISILGFMLLIASLYRLITMPQLIKSTPAFIWIALLFLIYTIVDGIFQLHSAKETVSAFKRYFQVWGLLFGLCWMDISKENVERWRRIVLIICLLQVPFCLHQLIFLVPIRESFMAANPTLVPIDVVAGTFGASMLGGGNNAEMATALIMVFAFLLARHKEKVLPGKKLFWISLVLLSPLFMGETKIVVILFPLMMGVLYRKELLTRPLYAVGALIFGSLFMAIILNAYMIVTKNTLDELIFETLRYNVYEVGYGDNYLNRTTVLTFWWQHQSLADPVSFLFGDGLGSTKKGSGDEAGGYLDTLYPMYGIGLTTVSTLLWEVGVFGMGLFLLMMAAAWRCAGRLMEQAIDPIVRADAAAIQTTIVLFSVYPLYRDTLLYAIGFQVLFTVMLGYLAWLHKQQIEYKT